jgi:gamma-glutamyltranspeptidase / glutathione hydrolase
MISGNSPVRLFRPMHAVIMALIAIAAAVPGCAGTDERSALLHSVPEHGPGHRSGALNVAGEGFRRGVVTAANPYGAEAGAKILEAGGNAVDAAVAITYALNVVEPQNSGIGGGGFMLIYLAKTGTIFAIDSREKAAAGATRAMFDGVPSPSLQGAAVGVPGVVRGTALAMRDYGNLSLKEVIQPAIELADKGFAATPRYAALSCNARAKNSSETATYFCPGGVAPVVGSLVTNKPLAETLRLIADRGPDCFYRYAPDRGCDIAKGIVEGQKFNRPQAPDGKGGTMTYADLENYDAKIRAPTQATYRGYTIHSMSPPSSGGLTISQLLKMLERFPIGDERQGFGFGSTKTVHVMAEAMRIAFADRSVWMGDADFADVPSRGLLNPNYLASRSTMIDPNARMTVNPQPGDPRPWQTAGVESAPMLAVAAPVTGPGETTTHYSVVDRWGNMVSYTNTIETLHGIGVFAGYTRADGTFRNFGFLLNNELTDFNTAPTVNPYTGEPGYNDIAPNKRPRSSMAPTMIFAPDGKPVAAFGSPGGATIINSVLNVAMNLIDHRMTMQDAINAPRVSVATAGGAIAVDPNMPQATIDELRALGHTVSITEIGSVQGVVIDHRTGLLYGGADSRREGTVIGLPRARVR